MMGLSMIIYSDFFEILMETLSMINTLIHRKNSFILKITVILSNWNVWIYSCQIYLSLIKFRGHYIKIYWRNNISYILKIIMMEVNSRKVKK